MLVDYEATIFFYPHLLQLQIVQKYTFFTPKYCSIFSLVQFVFFVLVDMAMYENDFETLKNKL